MATNKPQMLRFPLDKAGYINALLLQGELRQLMHNPFHRNSQLLQQADSHKLLINITKAISNGDLTYDRLQFYDNGEITVHFPSMEV